MEYVNFKVSYQSKICVKMDTTLSKLNSKEGNSLEQNKC